MSLLTAGLNSDKIKLLCYGYCRRNGNVSMPLVIFEICHEFLNELTEWKVSTHELLTKSVKFIQGPSISIKGIIMFLKLEFIANSIQCGLWLQHLPNHMEKIKCRFRLCCKEFMVEYRRSISFDHDTLGKCIRKWRKYALPLKRVSSNKGYKTITFTAYIEILSIDFATNNIDPFYKHINLSISTFAYKWNIDNIVLNKFKTCNNDELFYAPDNFGPNENFCLCVGPKDNDQNIVLYLQILALPYKIKSVRAKIIFEMQSINDGFYKQWDSDGNIVDFVHWPNHFVLHSVLHLLSSLTFSVTLEIFRFNQ